MNPLQDTHTRAKTKCHDFLFRALPLCTSVYYKYQASLQTLYTLTQPWYNSSRTSSFPCATNMNRPSACVYHPNILQQSVGAMNKECGSVSVSFFLLACCCVQQWEKLYLKKQRRRQRRAGGVERCCRGRASSIPVLAEDHKTFKSQCDTATNRA